MPTSGQLQFIESGRYMISLAEGGDSGYNIGVDYGALIRNSPYYAQIKALYKSAGLNLDPTRDARPARELCGRGRSLHRTQASSVNTGRLQVPELDVHTVSDQLAPVQFEATYAEWVALAGNSTLLRQVYANAIGHCNFTDADMVAAIDAMNTVVAVRHWTPGVTVTASMTPPMPSAPRSAAATSPPTTPTPWLCRRSTASDEEPPACPLFCGGGEARSFQASHHARVRYRGRARPSPSSSAWCWRPSPAPGADSRRSGGADRAFADRRGRGCRLARRPGELTEARRPPARGGRGRPPTRYQRTALLPPVLLIQLKKDWSTPSLRCAVTARTAKRSAAPRGRKSGEPGRSRSGKPQRSSAPGRSCRPGWRCCRRPFPSPRRAGRFADSG